MLRHQYCGDRARGDSIMKTLVRFVACESGATAIEYSLIAALIAVGIIGAIQSVGNEVKVPFEDAEAGLKKRH
jgi:pilus assembly protein Flp/PilA